MHENSIRWLSARWRHARRGARCATIRGFFGWVQASVREPRSGIGFGKVYSKIPICVAICYPRADMKHFPRGIEALESRIAPAAAIFELSSLDGANGFKLNGVATGDFLGRSVSDAGDINGDGLADMILGAPRADPNGLYSGASYVVFGNVSGFDTEVELSDLDGTNGFRLSGVARDDGSGSSVSAAGDLNGDGFGDLIIGARMAGGSPGRPGASYIVFGKQSGFSPNLNLSTLDGVNGFTLVGASSYEGFGWAVSAAGDVNGDGFDDVIVGAPNSRISPGLYGGSYVVFGKAQAFAARVIVSNLTGADGFRMTSRGSGSAVAGAGDVNGDGFDDLLIGAPDASPAGGGASASYVVFGKAGGFAQNLDLSTLDGTNGFQLNRVQPGDNGGRTVSGAGDFNGDGFDDLIIGAPYIGPADARIGNAYIIFGKATGFSAAIELSNLDGTNGFKVTGAAIGDNAGYSVSDAGDINGDGLSDVIIGAGGADPHGERSGSTFVIFGTRGSLPANLDLAGLRGEDGFRLDGVAFRELSGNCVSGAGDVNGDGLDDLMISAPYAEPNGRSSGTTYIVFGIPQSISINDVSVEEGTGDTSIASFTLSLSGSSTRPVTVKYTTADGTAASLDDYTAVPPTTVTFAPGEISKNVGVAIRGDRTFEPDETFLITLMDPTNATLAIAQGKGTIVNDDTLPAVSIADATVVEGSSGTAFAAFAVTLSQPSSQPIAVKYATVNGTATAPVDYLGIPPTDLTFAPGEISKLINVVVNGDRLYEADEAFLLVLSAPTNATLADAQGEAIVINDEDLPTLNINDASVLEGASGMTLATFTVSLTGESAFPVTVEYQTADGSAVAPDDYTALPSATLTFNPGELSKTLYVAVNGGTGFEPDESFFVNFSSPTSAVLGDATGEGTILNDDVLVQINSNGRKASFTDSDGDAVTIKTNRGSLDQENFVFGRDGTLLLLDLLPAGNAAEFANAAIAISTTVTAAGTGDGLVNLGAINATGIDLAKVKVDGNLGRIIVGDGDAARPAIAKLTVDSLGRLGVDNSVILDSVIRGAAGTLKVKHDVIGAAIAIEGNITPATSLEATALKKLQIGGSIADSFIGVGFNAAGVASNPDVQVGAISVLAGWRATSLAVGVADSTNNGFGRNDSLIVGGNAAIIARVASVVIRGPVEGSAVDGDFFGITAQQIGRMLAGSIRPALKAGADDFLLDPVNNDFRVVDFA